MKRSLLVFALLCGLSSPVVQADERTDAEYDRLMDEINNFSERQLWKGVEKSYEELLALNGVEVPFEAHMAAAQSARSVGDMGACLSRLLRAQSLQRTEELDSWIMEINQTYGRVQLVVTPPRPVEMTPAQMPFAPDQRRAVELAQKSLREDGVFIGMLPVGDYNIAGRQFDVTQGVGTQIELSAKELRNEKKKKTKPADAE